jgi:hypothetical protein
MSTGRFLKEPLLDSNAKAITIPSGASSNRPTAPSFGTFRFNTDIGKMEYFNGTVFKQVAFDGEKTLTINTFAGDASTTTFTLSTTPTSITQVLVFIGGVHQEATTHFTLSSDDITFDEAVPTGETVTVIQGIGQTPS